MWHPNGDDQPGTPIPVFAEIGRQSQVPGPLIRVSGGTDIIATLRNALPADTLVIHGLHSRPAVGALFNDSIVLPPRAVQTIRFRLDRPGTYYYWGSTTKRSMATRFGVDAQLTGAIVVDEPGQRPGRDRILVIGAWTDTIGSEDNRHRARELFVINGRSWPHTDRLVHSRGETVIWRVINATAEPHPMHLHGFFFRVNRRGDGRADLAQSPSDLVNTERMMPGATMTMSWVPERLGNWLFHCHIPSHIEARGPLGLAPERERALLQPGVRHASHATEMGGLVSAVEIRPAEDDTLITVVEGPTARRLRMHFRENLGSTPSRPFYGVAIDESGAEPPVETGQRVGPTLVLNRGEPVSITLRNNTPEPISIHWHGIELESFFDGVPGFSGMRPQLAPAVAPRDSFEVRFTPPRSGTFIYHAHLNETRHQRAGVAGMLIVAEKSRYDASREVPVLISSPSDSLEEERAVLINGQLTPLAVTLRRGLAHRIRLANITTARPGLRVELRQDTTIQTWRALAKDGAELPTARRVIRPAQQAIAIGETMDFEFFTARPGEYLLDVRTARGTLLGTLPLRVQ